MNQSEQIDELTKALVEADKEMPTMPLDGHNPFFNSKFTTLKTMVKLATPVLAKHGIKFRALPQGENLIGKVSHVSGQWESSQIELKNKKNDMQGEGSAISFGRRYLMSSMLNLVSDDSDDDGNSASGKNVDATPKKKVADDSSGEHQVVQTILAELEGESGEYVIDVAGEFKGMKLKNIEKAELKKFYNKIKKKNPKGPLLVTALMIKEYGEFLNAQGGANN